MLDYLRKLFHRVITSIHGHGNISSNSISTNDKAVRVSSKRNNRKVDDNNSSLHVPLSISTENGWNINITLTCNQNSANSNSCGNSSPATNVTDDNEDIIANKQTI